MPAARRSPRPAPSEAEALPAEPTPASPVASTAAGPAPLPPPAEPSPAAAVPGAGQQSYVVAEGDTLAIIADRFGVTVDALQAANSIANPDTIVVGAVLQIP
jgi:LysM repeat protein